MESATTGAVLIVGASQAGLQLAVSLRQAGYAGPITLVGEEIHPPYQRPPLSKEYLTGETDLDSLAFRAPSFYADNDIDLVCGERVTDVALPNVSRSGTAHTGTAQTGTAQTDAGRELRFDRLALTVGAAPRRLILPGSELTGICYLRDRDDAADLRSRLDSATRVVVVGGGFIGLEAAAAARAHGKHVTVVEAADRLIPRVVAPVVSEFYRRAHRRRGIEVLLSAAVTGFVGAGGRVTGVQLADGAELAADLVMIGVGVVPRTELAERLGLDCDGGIVVDSRARTSDPRVVAAGDCTVQPNPLTGQGRVRLESVQNAVAQATAAAATLAGRPGEARPVPWFWSYQGDLKLQIAGLSTGYDGFVVRGDPDAERFSVLYYRGGRLLAADAVNAPADYMAVRRALAQDATIRPEQAGDPGVALKSLIVGQAEAAQAA